MSSRPDRPTLVARLSVDEASARRLVAGDGLVVRSGRLLALDTDTSKKLELLIGQAAQCAAAGEPHKGGGAGAAVSCESKSKRLPRLAVVIMARPAAASSCLIRFSRRVA